MDEKNAVFKVAYRFLGPEELEAFAAEEDPTKAWIHFIFTDDKSNDNNQRVPVEEFESIVKSGKFMPIKKVAGAEREADHEGAIPMGAIASLKRVLGENKNTIEGLGTLWKREFPEDIATLKETYDKGEPIDFSWELLYTEEVAEEDGTSALKGCRTRAITIVDLPAYGGRTRALAMASEIDVEERLITGVIDKEVVAAADEVAKEAQRKRAAKYGIQIRPDGNVTKPKQYAHLNDSQFADPVNYAYPIDKEHVLAALRYWGKPKNKAKYNAKSRGIITKRMNATAKRFGVKSVQDKEEKSEMNIKELLEGLEPAEAVEAVSEKLKGFFEELEELKGHEEELAELRTFKEEREKEEAKATLLKTRLEKMKEAGVEVKDEDLEKKAGLWLSMDDEAFEFHINELVAFSTAIREGKASIPNLRGEEEASDTVKTVREGLKRWERKSELKEDN